MSLDAPQIERDDELLDITTFMRRNHLSRSVVFREIAAGRLHAWKVGGRRNVIPKSEEARWRSTLRRVTPEPLHPRRKYPIRARRSLDEQ